MSLQQRVAFIIRKKAQKCYTQYKDFMQLSKI